MSLKSKKILLLLSILIVILGIKEIFLKRDFCSISNAIAMDEKWRFHFLINLGEDIDRVDCIGSVCYTPLTIAVTFEKPYYVNKLLTMGAKTDIPNNSLPLNSAIYDNNEEIVNLLLNAGAEMKNSLEDTLAVLSSDNMYFLQLFLDRYDVPLEDLYCKTGDSYRILKYLLEAGVDPDYICYKDTNEPRKCIQGYSTKLSGLSLYDGKVGDNSVKLTQLLIEYNANINFQDDCNNTPLHYAAYNGGSHVVQTLLLNGAKTDLKNRDGHTAYELAEKRKLNWVLKAFDEFNASKK